MAKYDQGGGCACGLQKECDCNKPKPKMKDYGDDFDLVKFLEDKEKWSLKTFGPGPKTESILAHIKKELIEIEADPTDIIEWIDVILLGFDGALRAGYYPNEVVAALFNKQQLNKMRKWPDPSTLAEGQCSEHIKEDVIPS